MNKISDDWKIYKLGEMCRVKRNIYVPSPDDKRKYIGLEHIGQGTLSLVGVGDSTDVKSAKFSFKKGQILFGKLRPYFRKVVKPNFDGVCSTDILVIDAKEGFYNCFLFYFFANPEIVEEATLSSEGTRMPRASWDYLSNLQRAIPPLIEQKAIAKVLSDLDAKIELNQEMNKTIESIGQALFKRWFVDFEFPDEKGNPYKSNGGEMVDSELGEIPRGWNVGAIGDVVEINSGKRPKEKLDNKKGAFQIPLIGASSIMGYVKETLYDEPILIIGRVGTHGIVQRVVGPSFPSDNTLVIKSQYYEYVYRILKGIDYNSLNVGTTQPLITQTGIKNIRIIIPENGILHKFEQIISKLYFRFEQNRNEIGNLWQIRDSLLPRLMSGKIRVEVDI